MDGRGLIAVLGISPGPFPTSLRDASLFESLPGTKSPWLLSGCPSGAKTGLSAHPAGTFNSQQALNSLATLDRPSGAAPPGQRRFSSRVGLEKCA